MDNLKTILLLDQMRDIEQKNDFSARLMLMPCEGCEDEGDYVQVVVKKYTDWYQSVNGGPYRYIGSDYNGSTTEYVWVPKDNDPPSDSHEHTPGGSGGSGISSPHPRDVITDSSFDASKAGCVYRALDGGETFQNLIADYEDNGGTLNLSFIVGATGIGDNGDPVNGETFFNDATRRDVTIRINYSYQENARTVQIARTLLHESIHAKIYAYLRNEGIIDWDDIDQQDFPALYDAYVNAKTSGESYHHELMANEYIDIIAQGVEAFDEINANNPEITFEHYRALAWAGLTDTYVYNNVLTQTERDNIVAKRDYIISWASTLTCHE